MRQSRKMIIMVRVQDTAAVRLDKDVLARMRIFCTLHRVEYSKFLTDCMDKCGIPTLEDAKSACDMMDYNAAKRLTPFTPEEEKKE